MQLPKLILSNEAKQLNLTCRAKVMYLGKENRFPIGEKFYGSLVNAWKDGATITGHILIRGIKYCALLVNDVWEIGDDIITE